ncbi:hypothetical protein PCIT_a2448 [Pseudoalteromonas citrea]|uniref:Uncharacterized protein n=2 Tax=Pseudoalteromonas citrea TaxID=43655 RepID=A0AAD4AJZ7_9GAMM|nr:hypothetical protein [Pseudoalteromonas citrea]KAF7772386.1 hypothetical protein PCIT_a2448 [Pseudoalteromonas citrea]
MTTQFKFTIAPTETSDAWAILNEQGHPADELSIYLSELPSGQPVELHYALDSNSFAAGWRLFGNGTLFTDAQDNFNYQLSSEVTDKGAALVVTIANIVENAMIPAEVLAKMQQEKTQAFPAVPLQADTNYEVDFRVIAQLGDDASQLYFSQDPKIIIQKIPPN